MSAKTVTLTNEAYDALGSLKRGGESFSDVVRRLAGSQVLLSPYAGAWSEAPKNEPEEIRKFLNVSDSISDARLRRRPHAG